MTIDVAAVAQRYAELRERLEALGGGHVEIVAVTKAFDRSAIDAARAAGCTTIGENYAQELLAKRDACAGLDVHFIGQLQTNKVRQLAGLVDVYETVDRPRLAREIAARDPGASILIQLAPDGTDASKGGCPIHEADDLVELAGDLGLDVAGAMAVGPTDGGAEAARPVFRAARSLVDRHGLRICSIGMSADLDVAVAEGSTQLRVGRALFGDRPVPTRRTLGR